MNYYLWQSVYIIFQPHFIASAEMAQQAGPSFSIANLLCLIFDAFHCHLNSFKVADQFYHYLLYLKQQLITIINE